MKTVPKCSICTKGVGTNRKRLLCLTCKSLTHVACTNLSAYEKQMKTSSSSYEWICNFCTITELPFANIQDFEIFEDSDFQVNDPNSDTVEDIHLETLRNHHSHILNIAQLNTQSMFSTFGAFTVMMNTYPIYIVCLRETWLTNNKHLIQYVSIPGFNIEYRNDTNKGGGGVGIYIKEDRKYKVRKDIIELEPDLEHLWIEVEGKNKHSNILIDVVYQPNFDNINNEIWLERMDNVLEKVTSVWSGPIIIV